MTAMPEKPMLDRSTASSSSSDVGGDPYIRRMGRSFIVALHGATRAIRLYPVENEAVKKSLDDLNGVTTEILTREGEFELRVTSEFIFINQTRLRLDLDNYASFTQILSVFRSAGVGVAHVMPGVWLSPRSDRGGEVRQILDLLIEEGAVRQDAAGYHTTEVGDGK